MERSTEKDIYYAKVRRRLNIPLLPHIKTPEKHININEIFVKKEPKVIDSFRNNASS